MSALAACSRSYSVLLTSGSDDDRGRWHIINATSIGEALRGVRSGSLVEPSWSATGREHATHVAAIECLGVGLTH